MTTSSIPTPLDYGELNWLNGRAGRVGTAAAIYVAFCISVMLSGWGDDRVRAIVADAAYAPLVGLSVILCLLIRRHPAIDPAFRRAWGVMVLALAAAFPTRHYPELTNSEFIST